METCFIRVMSLIFFNKNFGELKKIMFEETAYIYIYIYIYIDI